MQIRIDDVQGTAVCFWMKLQLFQFLEIGFVDFLANPLNEGRVDGIDQQIADLAHFLDDPCIVGADDLAPVAPIDFIAIVLRRIVRRRDHDGGAAAEIAAGERDQGSGADLSGDVDPDAVARKHAPVSSANCLE